MEENFGESREHAQEQSPSTYLGDSTIGNRSDHTELLGVNEPITHRRSNNRSIDSSAMVEVPDDVLSSPSTLASRPPPLNRSNRPGPSFINRAGRQAHSSYPGLGIGIPERNEPQLQEGNPQGNHRHSPPHPVANIAGLPNLHIYNLFTDNGQRPTYFRMESSIRHAAVDLSHNEDAHDMRIWYSTPT